VNKKNANNLKAEFDVPVGIEFSLFGIGGFCF
jgi:hypothetical protein